MKKFELPIMAFAIQLLILLLSCQNNKPNTFLSATKDIESVTNENTNIYMNDTLGWTMPLPETWSVIKNGSIEKRVSNLSNNMGFDSDLLQVQSLINIEKGTTNFGAIIEPVSPSVHRAWVEDNRKMMLPFFRQLMPDLEKIDTFYSKEIIDNKTFDLGKFTIDIKGKKLYLYHYQTIIGKYGFTVSINSIDQNELEDILNQFKKSKFKKQKNVT
jgi:hypothetical protein